MLNRLFTATSPYLLWAVLAVPGGLMMVAAATSTDPKMIHGLVHPSGEFSARFMIIAMMATPLTLLLKGWRGPLWLKKNRRYFGVAAFALAILHTVFYLIDVRSLEVALAQLPRLYIWTGWLALLIFIPLAVTSMDYFVRTMGPRWKTLQRWTYGAAVLTLLHWAALHDWGGSHRHLRISARSRCCRFFVSGTGNSAGTKAWTLISNCAAGEAPTDLARSNCLLSLGLLLHQKRRLLPQDLNTPSMRGPCKLIRSSFQGHLSNLRASKEPAIFRVSKPSRP